MTTVFVGGSRRVSRLPAQAREQLAALVQAGVRVIVGDANGADKAVQRQLSAYSYGHVTVFCSGSVSRNNLGNWPACHIVPPNNARGFQFYAAKDRQMAQEADSGLMIWDGQSPGTILNVMRLAQNSKEVILLDTSNNDIQTIGSISDWRRFFANCSKEVRAEVRVRCTEDELALVDYPPQQLTLFDPPPKLKARA